VKMLALETSSDVGTVALLAGEGVAEQRIATPREQTELVLPLVDDLLSTAGLELKDLDGIAFGRGPGSFTGLRIAAAVAQGFGLAANLPLLPVSSLAAMAQGVWRIQSQACSLVCIDARMGEVFWGAYEVHDDLAELVGEERLSDPGAVAWPGSSPWGAVGSGFEVFADEVESVVAAASVVETAFKPSATDLLPQAVADLYAGRVLSAVEATPVYLRDESAWRK
jgi:tRNA threonylcarbamoyladenosine biosynthesis protein TsaB